MTAEKLLEQQIHWLIESRCAKVAGYEEQLRRGFNPPKISTEGMSAERIPFLLCPPPPKKITREVIEEIRIGGCEIVCNRDPLRFRNSSKASSSEERPLITAIILEKDKLDRTKKGKDEEDRPLWADERIAMIQEQGRRGLTLWEGIVLVACFPSILNETNVDLLGSVCAPSEEEQRRSKFEAVRQVYKSKLSGGIHLPRQGNEEEKPERELDDRLFAGIALNGSSPEIIAGPGFSSTNWSLVSCTK